MNLKQFSEILKLSQTTVSRALNGFPEVSEKTRNRVLSAAAQYNYHPNTQAKSLATGRSMAIGHVLPINKQEIINPIFADFIAGTGEILSRSGYHMAVTVVEDEGEEAAYRNMASNKSVDGVILHGPKENDSRITLLQELGIPFLVHGRAQNTEQAYSWFDINNRRAFKNATELLLKLGHQRIALLNGLEYMDFAVRRRQGYEQALNLAGIPTDTTIMRSEQMMEPYGYHATLEIMQQPNPPTAFLVSSVITAMGVQRALLKLGLRLAEDVSIVIHDDQLSFLPADEVNPLFTASRSSIKEAGKRCAQMLLEQINNPNSPPLTELWEAELVIGESTGPAPQTNSNNLD
ncbi:MAG: LacI family DNA-binding transcriptional regulator [Gammaproteobacteria bacterium]|nr:LacI family DNA-binding transcriptional regulator [Gammaproteobacteria bacterium]